MSDRLACRARRLVPPLCVVGYGLGTGSLTIAKGAGLLFVANFSAIIFLALIGFSLLGYGAVPVGRLERDHAEAGNGSGVGARAATWISSGLTSRAGAVLRVAMPLVLIVLVYFPLRHALEQLTWELHVRGAVNDVLKTLPGETVHSSVEIDQREVSIRLLTLGESSQKLALRQQLIDRVAKAAPGTRATVEISMLPDAAALAQAQAALLHQRSSAPPPPPPVPGSEIEALRGKVSGVLGSWPTEQAGALDAWHVGPSATSADAGVADLTVTVVHVGAPLGADARSVLQRSLSQALGAPVELADVALYPEPVEADAADGAAWLVRATSALTAVRWLLPATASLFACIELPDDPSAERVVHAVRDAPLFATTRVQIAKGTQSFSLRWSKISCTSSLDAGVDAAADGGP